MSSYDAVRAHLRALIDERRELLERDAETTMRHVLRFFPRHGEGDIAAGVRLHSKHDQTLAALESFLEAVDRIEADDIAVKRRKQEIADDLARRLATDAVEPDELRRLFNQVLERLRRSVRDGQYLHRSEQVAAALRGREIDEHALAVLRCAATTKRDIGLDKNRAVAFLRVWESQIRKAG